MARRATSLTKKPKSAEVPAIPEEKAAPAPRRGKKSKPEDMPPAEMSVADAFFPGGEEPPAETVARPAKARRSRKPTPKPAAVDDNHVSAAAEQPPAPVTMPEATPSAAASWDAGTGTATFDWPAIEHVAASEGPNQAMAKLLLAARAEGANSRWPF